MLYKEKLKANNADLEEILGAVNELPNVPPSRDSPLPITVATEEEMTAILTNATAESVGAVYKYVGRTTLTYEHGALYIIAEE